MAQPDGKRELIVSKTWLQVAGLVVLVGFFVLGLLAYRTYEHDPPIAERVVDPSGGTVFYLLADFRSAPTEFPWPEGERSGPVAQPERSV